jgi:hypothetical protein
MLSWSYSDTALGGTLNALSSIQIRFESGLLDVVTVAIVSNRLPQVIWSRRPAQAHSLPVLPGSAGHCCRVSTHPQVTLFATSTAVMRPV